MPREDVYKLIPYLLYDIPYSLPSNASPLLKRQIQLALMAYKEKDFDFENINEYIENVSDLDFSLDDLTLRDYCIDGIVNIIDELVNILKEGMHDQSSPYVFVYFNAMGRLKASFESSVILLRGGYYIESSLVFRLIFEQIAWAYSIIGKEMEKIEGMKVTKQIKLLNDLLPNAAQMYGQYSEEAHLDPKKIPSYLVINPDSNEFGYRYRSGERSKGKYYDLFFLSKLYFKSIFKFLEHLNVLNINTILNAPAKQINCTIKERLNSCELALLMFANQIYKIDGLDYDERLPNIKLIEELMI